MTDEDYFNIGKAEYIISQGKAFTYPSMNSAQYVRDVMKALLDIIKRDEDASST